MKGNKAEAVKFLKLSLKHDETNSKVNLVINSFKPNRISNSYHLDLSISVLRGVG